MSTPSSSARGPGPGPGSGSQITASVVKFRCMFTYDLRRKSKRWRDGYLKYHAFNKRVMVYDEQGNYVGDHHWQSIKEVQEGDELELDKGVLIDVGERMSTTQTDLTNLFEKRRSSQTSPQARDTHASSDAQAPRPPAATPFRSSASSQPFRSLNDLLGIRKTPAGPSATPAAPASPYEQRNRPPPRPVTTEPPRPEPAPKRQRISAERTNERIRSEVVDLTAIENEAVVPSREPQRPSKDSRPSMPPPREKPRSPTTTRQTRPDAPAVNAIQRPRADPSASKPKDARPTQERPRHGDSTAYHSPKAAPAPKPRDAEPIQDKSRPNASTTNHPPKAAPAPKQKDTEPIHNRPRHDNPPTHHPPKAAPAPKRKEPEPIQAVSRHDDPPIRSDEVEFQKPNPPPPRMPIQRTRSKFMYSAILQQSSSAALAKSSTENPSRQSVTKSTEYQSACLHTGPKEPHARQSSRPQQPKPQTETTNSEFLPSDSTQFILDEMAGVIGSENGNNSFSSSAPRNLPAKRSLDAPLRKSLSDPSALANKPTLQTRPTLMRSAMTTIPEPEEVDDGPWTSEAMDLFDFWPPGRPKPA